VQIVSSGASSTYKTAAMMPGVTEVQAGSYLTGDARYIDEWSDFDPALTVLTTVISRPSARRVTVDAGQKKLSSDAGLPIVKNLPGLRLTALNEEHGILEADESAASPRVGDQVEIIPSHGGTTINLYENIHARRGNRIGQVFEITGRGK
jgi:D-serine deaminase-like pyridoxal phosphate-dependent protein